MRNYKENSPIYQLALKNRKAAEAKSSDRSRKKAKVKTIPAIIRDINSILNDLSSKVNEGSLVVKEAAPKGSSCLCLISIYNADDIKRQEAESHDSTLIKKFKAAAKIRFALYAKPTDPDKLGTIAIYGEKAVVLKSTIDRLGYIFAHKVICTSIEIGRRPFLSVKIK